MSRLRIKAHKHIEVSNGCIVKPAIVPPFGERNPNYKAKPIFNAVHFINRENSEFSFL